MDFKNLIDQNMDLIKVALATVAFQFVTSLVTGFVIGLGLLLVPFLAFLFIILAFVIDILMCPFSYYLSLHFVNSRFDFDFVKILVSAIICYLISSLLSNMIPGLSTIFGLLYPFCAVILANHQLIRK